MGWGLFLPTFHADVMINEEGIYCTKMHVLLYAVGGTHFRGLLIEHII